jgi:hypothetical protein
MALNAAAKKWIRRLRSGKVEQGKYMLGDGERRSCLGVLCDLAVKEGIIRTYDPADVELPLKVRNWVGLRTSSGFYQDSFGESSLAQRNDHGFSFPRIAEIIVSQPKGLFKETPRKAV